jgi:trimethylamine corrinoid protein
MEKNNILEALRLAIINGEKEEAEKWSKEVIKEQIDPLIAISESIRKGLDVVGNAFRKGEFFLPELVMAGEAATASTAILETALTTIGSKKILSV